MRHRRQALEGGLAICWAPRVAVYLDGGAVIAVRTHIHTQTLPAPFAAPLAIGKRRTCVVDCVCVCACRSYANVRFENNMWI